MSAVAPEHPHGRNDPDELAVAGLVENPANLVNLLANLNRKAARSLLRREDLRALVDLELGMIEQDVECVEERSATLVAVLHGAAHPAHQAIGAFGRAATFRPLGRSEALRVGHEWVRTCISGWS